MPTLSDSDVGVIHRLRDHLITNDEYRNNVVKRCPVCSSNVQDRNVALYKELINCLYKVYVGCGQHKVHEFEMGNIKDLLDKNAYARFGDLVRFGGLVYRPKGDDDEKHKGLYGLNMARCKEFYNGHREIPVQITLNQITNEIIKSKYISVRDFPELIKFLDERGVYDYNKEV